MTENKRFTTNNECVMQNGVVYAVCKGEHNAAVVATVLNELIKENEQLKQSQASILQELLMYRNLVSVTDKQNRRNINIVQLVDLLNEFSDKNEQLKSKLLNIEEDRDYYKSKAGSLEEGYLQLQDREIRLKKENEQLKSEVKSLRIKHNDFSDPVDEEILEIVRRLFE